MQNADKHAAATGDPLMLSEFGATDDLATVRSNVSEADRHMVSWQYWHYCECLDPTTSGSGTQAIVVDPAQAPTGSNVKQAKLDVLSEPYPQLIAGTPSSYGFDPATSTFRLAYSTTGPGGRDFSRAAPKLKRKHKKHAAAAKKRKRKKRKRQSTSNRTQIFVGASHYPAGYSVSVEGGGIASKPNASLLEVIACPGRRNIAVTVSPPIGAGNQTSCKVTAKKRKPKRKRR
jgi:endoglycosylceramidase